MRSAFARAEGGSGNLANLAFGGALVAVAGMLFNTTIEYAAAHFYRRS
jgi:hypothetical protein